MHGEIANGDGGFFTASELASLAAVCLEACMIFTCKTALGGKCLKTTLSEKIVFKSVPNREIYRNRY